MADVTSFQFYDDPVAKTNPSSCDIDPVAGTLALPLVAGYPFAKVDELVAAIEARTNQDLADLMGEPTTTIYKDDGSVLLPVTATIAVGTPPTVTHVAAGQSYLKTKALDLVAGLKKHVLMLP